MRFVLKTSLSLVSLALAAGCGPSTSSTPTTDASTTDVQTTDAATADVQTADVPVTVDVVAPPTDVPAGSCGVSSGVATILQELSTANWAVQNRSRGMMMHGCTGATRPQDCLSTVPLVSDADIGANTSAISGAHLRLLFSTQTRSTYWSRSSADGRFFARGTKIHDIQRDVDIDAAGSMYDPSFFPDNSGYMYQPGGRLCPMSTLTEGMPTAVQIMGAGSPCSGSSVGLYEHLGASLGGEDYWASSAGSAAWDDGGRSPTRTETPRNEMWTATAATTLSLMANTGSGFTFVANRSVRTPFQGDGMISPSTRMMITRFVDESQVYQGYVLHRLDATHTGSAITATLTEIARYCTVGAKATFSYDERFVVYHHYLGAGPAADDDARDLGFTDAADPGFAEYASRGAANVYLLDLATGRRTRVTTMRPGQYALFPHFRSDGWIYFLVRTLGTAREFGIASDAALVR